MSFFFELLGEGKVPSRHYIQTCSAGTDQQLTGQKERTDLVKKV